LTGPVPVLFLDTAFHFPETYAFKERFAKRYGLNVVDLKPLTDPGPLYQNGPGPLLHHSLRSSRSPERSPGSMLGSVRCDRISPPAARPPELVEYHEIDGRPIVESVSAGALEPGGRVALHPWKTACRITRCSTRVTRSLPVPPPPAPHARPHRAPWGGYTATADARVTLVEAAGDTARRFHDVAPHVRPAPVRQRKHFHDRSAIDLVILDELGGRSGRRTDPVAPH